MTLPAAPLPTALMSMVWYVFVLKAVAVYDGTFFDRNFSS